MGLRASSTSVFLLSLGCCDPDLEGSDQALGRLDPGPDDSDPGLNGRDRGLSREIQVRATQDWIRTVAIQVRMAQT